MADLPDLSKLSSLIQPPKPPKPPEGPLIRILYCHDEDTLDVVPMFTGPPEYDYAMKVVVERKHTTPSGLKHIGQVYVVEESLWADRKTRKTIVDQFRRGGSKGLAEMDSDYYNSRDTFSEDAMTCYSKHLRPVGACADYRSADKKILPNTAKERKEAGLAAPSKAPGASQHICSFCPVESFYAKKRRGD